MPINVNEAIQQIKRAGASCARAVPMPNQNVNSGDYQIEIKANEIWSPIVTGVSKKIAEDIINQSTNRVILG